MKTLNLTALILLICSILSHAQTQNEIDEALKFYPLEVGNYWEYRFVQMNQIPPDVQEIDYSVEVVGDTTLANNMYYFKLKMVNTPSSIMPHYYYNRDEDEAGNVVIYILERRDVETADVYQWTPDVSNPFAETKIDSLMLRNDGVSSTSIRWPSGLMTVFEGDQQIQVFGEPVAAIHYQMASTFPLTYQLGRNFGLVHVFGEEGGNSIQTDLMYFRDADGNEFGEPIFVYVPDQPEHPGFINLHPNYPNPFNSTTNINFELAEPAKVQLDVYDLTGRRVANLLNEQRTAGTHSVQFGAVNLASGVYIYRLQAGTIVQSRKMVMVK